MSGQLDAEGGSNISPKVHPSSAAETWGCGRRKKAVPRKVSTAIGSSDIEGTVVHLRFMLIRGKLKLKMQRYYCKKARQRTVRHKYSKRDETVDELEFVTRTRVASLGQIDKQCASCDTKKTLRWRDTKKKTPLCGSCGQRYRRYKVRCTECWNVPHKDGRNLRNCGECGGTLLPMAMLKPSE